MEKTNNKNLLKIIGIILTINIVLSIILTFTNDGNPNIIVRFIDNLFILGASSLVLSFIFGIIKFIISYKNRKILKERLEAKKKQNSKSKAYGEKIFLRKETFNMLYRAFSITGFICFLVTIIIVTFI